MKPGGVTKLTTGARFDMRRRSRFGIVVHSRSREDSAAAGAQENAHDKGGRSRFNGGRMIKITISRGAGKRRTRTMQQGEDLGDGRQRTSRGQGVSLAMVKSHKTVL